MSAEEVIKPGNVVRIKSGSCLHNMQQIGLIVKVLSIVKMETHCHMCKQREELQWHATVQYRSVRATIPLKHLEVMTVIDPAEFNLEIAQP